MEPDHNWELHGSLAEKLERKLSAIRTVLYQKGVTEAEVEITDGRYGVHLKFHITIPRKEEPVLIDPEFKLGVKS